MKWLISLCLTSFVILGSSVPGASEDHPPSNPEMYTRSSWPEQDLRLVWMSAESAHFCILFPLQLERFAASLLAEAETIYDVLGEWTGYFPKRKVGILVTDNSDFANGFVKRGSKGLFITIQAVLPYLSSSSGYDAWRNWYRSLLIHELAHIFHLDIAHGGPEVLRKIFGNVIYPNSCTPPLYIEGFATYAETVLDSGYGRMSSPMTRMHVRASRLEGNFPTLDRAANSTPIWPAGHTPYLFGVSFLEYLSSRYGEECILRFNQKSGSYPMYMWGIPFKRIYGKRMGVLWDEWRSSLDLSHSDAGGENDGPTVNPFEPMGAFKGTLYSVSIDPAGRRIAYSGHPDDSLGGLYLYDLTREKNICLRKGLYAHELTFSRDGTKLYYISHEIFSNVYVKKNVYVFDLNRKKERRLTDKGNVQSFLLLENEQQLLVCVGSPFGTRLYLTDITGRDEFIQNLLTNAPVPVLEEPSRSPDGQTIAFSYKDGEGKRGICVVSLEKLLKGKPQFCVVSDPSWNAYSPVWLNCEELLCVSDHKGSYDLYSINVCSGNVTRLTEVNNGVFEPDLSEGGTLVLKEYTSEGYRASSASLERLSGIAFERGIDFGTIEQDGVVSKAQVQEISKAQRYKPGRWLMPGYWLPFAVKPDGNPGFGVFTSAHDPLKRHVYRTALLYDAGEDTIDSFFDYTYNTAFLSYFFLFSASQDPFAESFDPAFALHPGISYLLRKRGFQIQTDLGVIGEAGYGGIDVSFTWNTLKGGAGWIGPERGCYFSHGTYYNLSRGDRFAIIDDYFSQYFRPFGISMLNVELRGKGGIGREVVSGSSVEYVYLPLNGLYTLGFPRMISGTYVFDVKFTVGFPLLRIERGIGAFPLFFRGMSIRLFSENGFIFPDEEGSEFSVRDPRSSIGSELNWDFLAGYEFPLSFQLGYVRALSEGGRNGLYATFKANVLF
jgi:hypothetical protein